MDVAFYCFFLTGWRIESSLGRELLFKTKFFFIHLE